MMSESENQEPVCSSESSSESRVSKLEEEQNNEAEAKPGNSPTSSGDQSSERRSEPDLVSSSKESPGPGGGGGLGQGQPQIRNNQEIRVRDNRQDDEDEDDDSNDGVGGSNGDRELFNAPICGPYSLHSSSNSKSNPFGSATSQNILRGPILRPSAFKFSGSSGQQQSPQQSSSSTSSSSGFVLRPPKLIPNSGSVGCKVQAQATSTTGVLQFVPLEKDGSEVVGGGADEGKVGGDEALRNCTSGGVDSSSGGSAGGSGGGGASSSNNVPGGSRSSGGGNGGGGGFVFGSNLEERAVQGSPPGGKKRKIDGEEEDAEPSSSGGGIKKPSVVISSGEDGVGGSNEVVSREVITGEEGEVNVLQLHCRLFIFDGSNSTWVERGRGLLRLNDSKTPDEKNVVSSRLIIRTKGSLRVMLNTKVWDGMRVEKVGDKNVRLMAVDLEAVEKEESGGGEDGKEGGGGGGGAAAAVRIFLVMTTSIADAYTLVNALELRVRRLGV